MTDARFTLTHLDVPDGHRIGVRLWPATTDAVGVLHWMHGMAEHGGRYQPLADVVNAAGWHLCVHDHRGHGESVSAISPQGHFADHQGWQRVLDDVTQVQDWLRGQFSALPIVLAGHSMGSFVALAWAEQHHQDHPLAGLVLCGSDYSPTWFYRVARLPMLLERRRCGGRGSSMLIHNMTFGAWAKKLKNRHTGFDWLSRDHDEVRAYIDDPQCGYDCSTQLWIDLIGGLVRTHSSSALRQLPPSLPMLLVAGDSDPMSRFGKGMPALQNALRRAGARAVTLKEYAGARHEILNDYCRAEVQQDLLRWLADVHTPAA